MISRTHAPLILTLALLVVLAAVLVAGGWSLRKIVAASFTNAQLVSEARLLNAGVLKAQLDEETGIRGYAAIHQKILLAPYYEGRAALPGAAGRLRATLEERRVTETLPSLNDAVESNRRWLDHVAKPLLSRRKERSYLELHGKMLVDRFRIDLARIDAALARHEALADQRVETATFGVGIFAASAVALIALAALLFAVQQYRLGWRLEQKDAESQRERGKTAQARAALEAEKRVADTLQEAFLQRLFPTISAASFSATYLPATEEAKVGGDWYDAVQLSENRVLLAIGDVTGHGIDAVIAMNRARQLLISSALLETDPKRLLERLNAGLLGDKSPIVTAIAGIIDTRTLEFAYAAAGHPPPVLFEPGRRARLLEFGSLPLGVVPDAVYQTHRVATVRGAMIVLYTDGAIEHSRDLAAGEAALLEAVESAGRADIDAARAIRERIFSSRDIADDVAILAVRLSERRADATLSETAAGETTFATSMKAGMVFASGPRALGRTA